MHVKRSIRGNIKFVFFIYVNICTCVYYMFVCVYIYIYYVSINCDIKLGIHYSHLTVTFSK